jgi:hypothetical protein
VLRGRVRVCRLSILVGLAVKLKLLPFPRFKPTVTRPSTWTT